MRNIFTGKHISLFVVGIVVMIAGYIFLAQGPVDNPLSLSVAPVLFIVAYCVIIPVAIICRDDEQTKFKK